MVKDPFPPENLRGEESLTLLAHQYLLDRLHPTNKTYTVVAENLRLLQAGQRGEERLLHQLSTRRDGFALHNVCLELGAEKVQIDCLFITSSLCLVLESKNISGALYFDPDTDEFYRVDNEGSTTFFPNPYYQLTRHIRFMEQWLRLNKIHIPVTGAVILTSKSVTLRNNPNKLPIYKLDSLTDRINNISSRYRNTLNDAQLHELREKILQSHRPYTQNYLLEYYGLSVEDIIKGIVCSQCRTSSLNRGKRSWVCPKCNFKTQSGLQQAVEQYLLLVKPTITNKEFREFFGVESMKTANKLLSNLKLQKHGEKKNRSYSLLNGR